MFCTCQPKNPNQVVCNGWGWVGRGGGTSSIQEGNENARLWTVWESAGTVPGKVEIRARPTLDNNQERHAPAITELQTGQSFKCLGLLNASRVVKCDVEGSDEGFTPSVSLPRESTTVPKNVIWLEKYRLRKVSNFGDGDSRVGEIHTRVRNSPIPVLATRLLARGYFRARACISQSKRGTVDLLSSSLFLQFQS